jgi:hypothetical protein
MCLKYLASSFNFVLGCAHIQDSRMDSASASSPPIETGIAALCSAEMDSASAQLAIDVSHLREY